MNRCKDCRYFSHVKGEIYSKSFMGDCSRRDKIAHEDADGCSDVLVYWAGDDYGGGFEVGEDFGCVHWKKK